MIIAFDYGGTISGSANTPVILKLARDISKRCKTIHCISANYKESQESLKKKILSLKIPWAGIHIVEAGVSDYHTGINKVLVMKQLGIKLLIDDSEDVCRAVRDSGLGALCVGKKNKKEKLIWEI